MFKNKSFTFFKIKFACAFMITNIFTKIYIIMASTVMIKLRSAIFRLRITRTLMIIISFTNKNISCFTYTRVKNIWLTSFCIFEARTYMSSLGFTSFNVLYTKTSMKILRFTSFYVYYTRTIMIISFTGFYV